MTANWAAFEAGKLNDTLVESEPAGRPPPAITGGHQKY